MNTYKITNITNLFGKREAKFNTIVDIQYVDDRMKKNIRLEAGENVFLTVHSLPLSVHRLRIKKLIEITEVNFTEQPNIIKPNQQKIEKPKPITKITPIKIEEPIEIDDTFKKNSKKKNSD
jgi:hypothetical protein